MTLRGGLFGLDGTLPDHDSWFAAALTSCLPALGVNFTPELHATW